MKKYFSILLLLVLLFSISFSFGEGGENQIINNEIIENSNNENSNLSNLNERAEEVVDVGICDQITANGGHNDKCGEGQINFLNSSFEEPYIGPTGYKQEWYEFVTGWKATNSIGKIEIWTSPFAQQKAGAPCQDGHQCVEVNATEQASLYNDFKVKPGQFLHYSFYHMARIADGEKLELRIGKPNYVSSNNKINPTMGGVADRVKESVAKRGEWVQRVGIYQVPEDYASDGNFDLRIAFLSMNNSSMGNLIDNVQFYTVAVYDNDVSISAPDGGITDPTTDVFKVSNKLKYFNRDILSANESSVTYDISNNVELVSNSLKIEGVEHSDFTYENDTLVVNNLPEIYEDIDIEYDVKFKGTPNVANIRIKSYLEYASKLVVESFPTEFNYFDVTDNYSMNVSYATEGYCSGIIANNGYSEDCIHPENIVYDNRLFISGNVPTLRLENKIFKVENKLINLNTDKNFIESTTTLEYEYKKNMNIDFSTLKINGIAHTSYDNVVGAIRNTLRINDIPDYGASDYTITFDMKYNFSTDVARDVFVSEFVLISTLNYENIVTENSFVSDLAQMNLSYSTNIILNSSISDNTSNNLLGTSEELNATLNLYNDSPVTINNVVVSLISDTSKLQNTVNNLVIRSGTEVLVLNTDYTLNGSQIIINSVSDKETLTVEYTLTALNRFETATNLNNSISVFGDEYTSGTYLSQAMNIDVVDSTIIEILSSVTDNQNNFAGNDENLFYKIIITNIGSFDIKKIEINNLINSNNLDSSISQLIVVDDNDNQLTNISYTNNKLVIDYVLAKDKGIEITFKVNTARNIIDEKIDNTFNVITTTYTGEKTPAKLSTASINVSKKPVINVLESFVSIDINQEFDISKYATAEDIEDGNISSSISYSPSINISVAGIHKISLIVYDSDNMADIKEIVVLVDDGNFAYGTNKVMYAKSFEKYVSEVVVDEDYVIIDAMVYVFDKLTGEATADIISVDMGAYKAVSGQYEMVFKVENQPSLTRTIIAKVKTGTAPVITGANFKEINVGDNFDPMLGIESYDDFDLSVTVTYSGDYNVNIAGIYVIRYSATDRDKNTTIVDRILLVNNNNYSAGDTYIIYSESFDKRVGQVVATQDAVLLDSKTKVFDKQTGERVSTSKLVDLNGYAAVVNTYEITISVKTDSKASIKIYANIGKGEIPTLTTPTFTEINVGETIDLMVGVTATDLEDGIVIVRFITITGTINVNKAGVYAIDYSVTDSDGNTVINRRVVVVNDGSYEIGDLAIIQAFDFYKLITEVDTSDSAIINSASAKVYNKVTGELLEEELTVVKNGYSSEINIYTIEFSISIEPTLVKAISAIVSEGHDPVINGDSFVEIQLGIVFNPTYGISGYDIEDGDLTNNIIIIQNDVNYLEAGIYLVIYELTDSTGNTVNFTSVVLVNDGNYFVGDDTVIYANSFYTLISDVDTADQAIIDDARVDLFSKTTGISIGTTNITVDAIGYTNTKGKYNITFTNSNDLKATITIIATVGQGSEPILDAPKFVEIALGDGKSLGENLWDKIIATDNEDLDITQNVMCDYIDIFVSGFQEITCSVEDSDTNLVTKNIIVLVNDGTYSVGNTYIIQAFDFTKRVGEVVGSKDEVLLYAGVKIFDKKSGTNIDSQYRPLGYSVIKYLIDLGGYTSAEGVYDINFAIEIDESASITIKSTIVKGLAPIIDGSKIVELDVNETFDIEAGMAAYDFEDGDITENGKVMGTVVTSVPGIYKLVYYITDSDGNYVEFNRYVIVNDGRYLITDKTVIQATDFSVRVGEVNLSLDAINEEVDFKIYDIESESEIALHYTLSIGEYRAEVGTYNIVYYVYEDNKIIEKQVEVKVTKGNAPIITVPNSDTFKEINLNQSFDILDGIKAVDAEDGDITSSIRFKTNLDVDLIGVYTIRYVVIDSDNNATILIVVVVVEPSEFSIGDLGIVYAQDFEKYINEVDTSNDAILKDSDYKTYSKLTGEELSTVVKPHITTEYNASIGKYEVKFVFDEDPSVTHVFNITVNGDTDVDTGSDNDTQNNSMLLVILVVQIAAITYLMYVIARFIYTIGKN